MAERGTKRKKVLSLEAKQRKRERDKHFGKTRVNIGAAYARWRELKEATQSRSDGDLALLLLDSYKRCQDTSSSSKSCDRKGFLKSPVSSIKEECDQDQDVPASQHELGEQRLPEEKETSHLEESYRRCQDTSSSSESCDRKGSPKSPVFSIKEECDQDQDVPASQHELGEQRLPEEKETSHLEESYRRCQDTSSSSESCDRKGSPKSPVSSIKEECDQDQDVPASQHELGEQRLPEEKETSHLEESYRRCQDTSSPSESCDRKGSPKSPVFSIKEECDQDQDVPASQHELGEQRLPEEKETSHLEESFLSSGLESHLQRLEKNSSDDFCENGPSDNFIMSSTNEDQDTSVDPSVQSPAPGQELEKKAATCQSLTSSDEQKTKENNKNRVKDEENEELITSISVGDRRYQVDLGSSSEIIVDEECILQLFESCRKCNQKCTVGKHVTGLKIVVNQVCGFCQSHCQWTNLPDDEDSDFQVNEQTSVTSQNSKTGS